MFDSECKKALVEMRALLEDIDQKISHLMERDLMDRRSFDNNKIYDDD